MLKKISFLVAALLATALMGCEQSKKPVQTAEATETQVQCHKSCSNGCNPDGSCK